MSSADQNIRRMGGADPKFTSWKPATKADAAVDRHATKIGGSGKGSSASSQVNRRGNEVVGHGANDWKAEQQRNQELRGSTLYVYPLEAAAGTGKLMQGATPKKPSDPLSPVDGNMIRAVLTQDVTLAFDWSGYDQMAGSMRGNIQISRGLFFTLIIIHNGFKVTLPNDVYWNEGIAPDLSAPSGSRHVLNFFAIRHGAFVRISDPQPITEVYGGAWGTNMAKANGQP